MRTPTELFEFAKAVRLNAHAPYSKFYVGACIETVSGHVFCACNVENAAYSVAICAESNAIGAMVASGETAIAQVAVIVDGPKPSAPCGACRQRIYEFAAEDTPIHLFNTEGEHVCYTLGQLLPHAFGPADLA